MPTGLPALGEEPAQHRKTSRTDRQVDPEDKGPAYTLDEKGAERRPEYCRDAKDTGEVPLHPRPLRWRVDVPDNGGCDRLDRTGAYPLQSPENDERLDLPGEAAQQRCREKQARAGEEHRLAAIEIGQPAIDRDRNRLGQ